MDKEKIIEEAFKKLESKEFRYGNKDSKGVKHGVNISDAKKIVKEVYQRTKQQMEKENIDIINELDEKILVLKKKYKKLKEQRQ